MRCYNAKVRGQTTMSGLVMNPGQTNEKVFPFKNGPTTIGRAKENDIVVLDASLSRMHARIKCKG